MSSHKYPPGFFGKGGLRLRRIRPTPCHGVRLNGSEMAFDLRKFPPGQRERFLTSVTRGKNQMPPWGDFFKPDQLDMLWAYISAGERWRNCGARRCSGGLRRRFDS